MKNLVLEKKLWNQLGYSDIEQILTKLSLKFGWKKNLKKKNYRFKKK